METSLHDSADRLVIAALSGIAAKHAGLKIRGGYDRATAAAELHFALGNVPAEKRLHLLAHATPSTRHQYFRTIKAMLVEAGADEDEVDEIAEDSQARLDQFGFPLGTADEQG